MVENDISPFFVLKKIRDGEELRMDQKHIKIRMNSDKVMAIHYWVGANFRGIIDGKDDSLPVDYDYKILMLEEYKCPSKVELQYVKRSSKFRPKFTLADSE